MTALGYCLSRSLWANCQLAKVITHKLNSQSGIDYRRMGSKQTGDQQRTSLLAYASTCT